MGYQISNKQLMLLVVLSIIISVGSIFLSWNQLRQITQPIVTGYATDLATGRANLSITTTVSITIDQSVINFGGGSVNTSRPATFADLYSNHTESINGTWVYLSQNISVRNDGNILLNLTINGSNATSFFTQGDCGVQPTDPLFKWILGNDDEACAYSGGNVSTTWYDFTEKNQDVCNVSMSYSMGYNTIYIWVWVRVPQDVAAGCMNKELNNTLTFTGTGG